MSLEEIFGNFLKNEGDFDGIGQFIGQFFFEISLSLLHLRRD